MLMEYTMNDLDKKEFERVLRNQLKKKNKSEENMDYTTVSEKIQLLSNLTQIADGGISMIKRLINPFKGTSKLVTILLRAIENTELIE